MISVAIYCNLHSKKAFGGNFVPYILSASEIFKYILLIHERIAASGT
jgi:hypothetical protein